MKQPLFNMNLQNWQYLLYQLAQQLEIYLVLLHAHLSANALVEEKL